MKTALFVIALSMCLCARAHIPNNAPVPSNHVLKCDIVEKVCILSNVKTSTCTAKKERCLSKIIDKKT